jgi:antitoxin component YwqK of YwqJK toxin-antitoxin module
MKKLIIILLFHNGFAQKENKIITPPAIPINSLQLQIKVKEGKEYYNYIDQNDGNIENKYPYNIWIHTRYKKSSVGYKKIGASNEGNDIIRSSSNLIQGQFTGVETIGGFFNGYKTGQWKTTYNNKLVKTVYWNNGLITGLYYVTTTKGTLLYKTDFGPKGNGKFKDYYYKTGVLKQEGDYQNGKKEGEWCNYNTKGELTTTVHYKQGVVVK